MTEVEISPRNKFSFIRLPRRGRLEGAQLLENFDGVPSPNNDNVLYYKLLRSPSDHPPDGRDSADRVEDLGADGYQNRLNQIAETFVKMSRPTDPTTTGEPIATEEESTRVRKEWAQYLNVMYIASGPPVSGAAD